MQNIFVTGESGTIPMQIQSLAKNYDFKVINTQLEENWLTSKKRHQSFKVRKCELDFLDRDLLLKDLDELWKDVDLIIHSGAFVGTDFCGSDPTMAIRTNVEGTQNIVDVCNKYKIPLIYLSTTAILDPNSYGFTFPITEETTINPQTIYGISKYAGELIVQNTCTSKRIVLRPVFGFGNYPDDLHSALTKVIYVIYRNIIGTETELTVLLNKEINKSYTRVENIANCILRFSDELLKSDQYLYSKSPTYNIGENFKNSRNWNWILKILENKFSKKLNIEKEKVREIFNTKIKFVPEKDYLHYHNIDDSKLSQKNMAFEYNRYDNISKHISLSQGIGMTIDSVIKNISQEPYWL